MLLDHASENWTDRESRFHIPSGGRYEDLRLMYLYVVGKYPGVECKWAEDKIASSLSKASHHAKEVAFSNRAITVQTLYAQEDRRVVFVVDQQSGTSVEPEELTETRSVVLRDIEVNDSADEETPFIPE